MFEVTLTDTAQEPGLVDCAGTDPPIKDMVVPMVVTAPPQVLITFTGSAKNRPAGSVLDQAGGFVDKVSTAALGLNKITLNLAIPPADIDNGLKLLLIPGAVYVSAWAIEYLNGTSPVNNINRMRNRIIMGVLKITWNQLRLLFLGDFIIW